MVRMCSVIALFVVWCQISCEFRDESNSKNDIVSASGIRTDLTFAWGDSVGSHEIVRSFESAGKTLINAPAVPMATVPEVLTLQGYETGSSRCVVKLWVSAEKPVKLDCITIEGSKEITIRGLNLAIPPNADGLHPVRIEIGATSINFSLRTLPVSIPFARVARTVSIQSVGTVSSYHQVAAFEISRGAAGAMTVSTPTKVAATVRRKLVRFGYNFDFMNCELANTSERQDEDIAVEAYLVPDDAKVEKDWPQFFSLDSQLVQVPKEKAARVLIFVAHPFLDKVYGPGDFKEHSYNTTVTEQCQDRSTGFGGKPIPSRSIMDVELNVHQGRDEADPLLIFSLTTLQAYDAQSFELDKKPVASPIAAQSFELTLNRDGL